MAGRLDRDDGKKDANPGRSGPTQEHGKSHALVLRDQQAADQGQSVSDADRNDHVGSGEENPIQFPALPVGRWVQEDQE